LSPRLKRSIGQYIVLFYQKKWKYALVTTHMSSEEESSSYGGRLTMVPAILDFQVSGVLSYCRA
jgi:hypothetical protein